MVNKVFLVGHVTRDVELRYTASGTAVTTLGLAMNKKLKDGEKTTFVDIEVWDKLAELMGEYVKKGKQLHVEGRLEMDSWEDKETGAKRSKLKVVAEEIQFLGKKDD